MISDSLICIHVMNRLSYAVPKRLSVGNTAMDAELALWMSNIAKIDSRNLINEISILV